MSSHAEQGNMSKSMSDPFESPLFRRLLEAVEKQVHHTETLQKEALKDERAYALGKWGDEPAWKAMYKMATAITKEMTDEWKDGMDATLIFIALFLTVVTAFLVPANAALNPPPVAQVTTITVNSSEFLVISGNNTMSMSSPPPVPPKSAQIVCFFFYMALIVSMMNAMLCVLGRQWSRRLNNLPQGKAFAEKTMRHQARREVAKRWLEPLINSLHGSLFLSIALFVAGLMYQLWVLSISFVSPALILLLTGSLGTLLSVLVVVLILTTIGHAVLHNNSPFETPLSNTLRSFVAPWTNQHDRLTWLSVPAAKNEWREELAVQVEARQTFGHLVAIATEADLLDPTSSSLLDTELAQSVVDSTSWIKATLRMFATDTSTRCKVTTAIQLPRFIHNWHRPHNARTRIPPLDGIAELQAVLGSMWEDARSSQMVYHWEYFRALSSVIGAIENNTDITFAAFHSLDACIGALLSSMPPSRNEGRVKAYEGAVFECSSMLRAGRLLSEFFVTGDVPLTFSWSLLVQPYFSLSSVEELARGGIKAMFGNPLPELAKILNHSKGSYVEERVTLFLQLLLEQIDDAHDIPPEFDLSKLVALVCYSNSAHEWHTNSRVLMGWVDRIGLTHVSDRKPVIDFFQYCLDESARQHLYIPTLGGFSDTGSASDEDVRIRANLYLPCCIDLPPLSNDEMDGTIPSEAFVANWSPATADSSMPSSTQAANDATKQPRAPALKVETPIPSASAASTKPQHFHRLTQYFRSLIKRRVKMRLPDLESSNGYSFRKQPLSPWTLETFDPARGKCI